MLSCGDVCCCVASCVGVSRRVLLCVVARCRVLSCDLLCGRLWSCVVIPGVMVFLLRVVCREKSCVCVRVCVFRGVLCCALSVVLWIVKGGARVCVVGGVRRIVGRMSYPPRRAPCVVCCVVCCGVYRVLRCVSCAVWCSLPGVLCVVCLVLCCVSRAWRANTSGGGRGWGRTAGRRRERKPGRRRRRGRGRKRRRGRGRE